MPTGPVKSTLSKTSGATSLPWSSRSAQRVCVAPMSAIKSMRRLRVQVWNACTLELRNHVLQNELAFFQPLQHQLIDLRIADESRDDEIEVAVLDAQLFESLHAAKGVSFYLVVHGCFGSAPTNRAAGRQRPESEGSAGRLWSCIAAAGRRCRSYGLQRSPG